jgi:hypothetical protein
MEPKFIFESQEKMAKDLSKRALDDFLYDGKSIREWIIIINNLNEKINELDNIVYISDHARIDESVPRADGFADGVRETIREIREIINGN